MKNKSQFFTPEELKKQYINEFNERYVFILSLGIDSEKKYKEVMEYYLVHVKGLRK